MTISALIIARNEENKIQRSLKSLDFVNEIIVILDRTTDKTKSMSVLYTNKIYGGSWESEGERRNYGISKCNSDWILEIDADEVVSKKLANEILEKTNHSDSDFYYIPIKNYVGELAVPYGWMSCMAPDGKFSLFKKNCKNWANGRVHPSYKLVGRKGETLINPIAHFMSNNISDLLKRFNRNSSLYAEDLKSEKNNLKKLRSLRKVFSRFIKSYISRKGYKSGGVGILIGILCAIYPFVSAIKSKND